MNAPIEKLEKALGEFIKNVSKDPDQTVKYWKVLRNEFIVVQNTKFTYDLTPKVYELINIVQSRKDFEKFLGTDLLVSVFPSMKYKVHMEDIGNNECMFKIRAPTIPIPRTPRMSATKTAFEAKNTFKPPKTARKIKKLDAVIPKDVPLEPFPPYVQKYKKSPLDYAPYLKVNDEIEEKLTKIPEPWNAGFKLENEVDALTYCAAVEPSADFLQFHIGKKESNVDPYAMKLERRVEGKEPFETISRRGVTNVRRTGDADFEPIDRFVTSKTQYKMLSSIKFFAQFKLNKSFRTWKLMSIRKTFLKRLDDFEDVCWNAKISFPPVNFFIRKQLLTLRDFDVFPIKKDGEVEFLDEKDILYDAREDFAILTSKAAKEIYEKLVNFTNEINKKYELLLTRNVTNYLDDKEIPSELYTAFKVANKKSLSMTKEKQLKIDYKKRVQKAKLEVEKIRNFFLVADKTILTFFLTKLSKEYHTFSSAFTDQSHQVFVHATLDYGDDGEIRFFPSMKELTETIDGHVNTLFSYLSTFTRPVRINPEGGGKETPLPDNTKTIREFVQESEAFSKDTNDLHKIIEDSYKEAMDSLLKYQPSARAVYKFKQGWEEMKRTQTNPTVYIQNLALLTGIREQVETFKANYMHKLLYIDVKKLRSTIISFVDETIQENNSILFALFENICSGYNDKVNDLIKSLVIPDDSLEETAQFNVAINNAEACQGELDETFDLVNTIFKKAMTEANSVVSLLSVYLKSIRATKEKYEKCLADAKEAMRKSREAILKKLVQKQGELEKNLDDLETKNKEKYSEINPQMLPEVAIADLKESIDQVKELMKEIDNFKETAEKLEYTSYNFDRINKLSDELNRNLDNWTTYSDFIKEINSFTEANVKEVDYKELILFLNSHNEREMRSVHHPLYDKMANYFAVLYQYLPFFVAITKMELTDEIWDGIFDILKVDPKEMESTSLKRFLHSTILNYVDAIRIYIMNLQQKADLSQTFDKFIIQVKALVLTIKPSKTIKTDIITFPSIYDVLTTCESFQIYLRTLKNSQFYATIEKQVLYWEAVIYQLVRVLATLLEFQTKYVIVSEATSALFGELHFPSEEHAKSFIDSWYAKFINQVKNDPHVLLLATKVNPDNPAESNARKQHKKVNFEDILRKDFSKEKIIVDEKEEYINKEYEKPICRVKFPAYQGEVLVQCLEEGTTRCDYIFNKSRYLLDQQRQKFPRFFFCTDSEVIEILLACTNIRFIVNDLVPIFPSLSRFQCSEFNNAETIIGVIATNGEMLQFRTNLAYESVNVIDILSRIETETKHAVLSAILEAISAREYTEMSKWIVRYPTQALTIAESAFFYMNMIKMVETTKEQRNWDEMLESNEEIIKTLSKTMATTPTKCSSIAALTALKIRHRDILQELKKNNDTVTPDSFLIRKHLFHKIAKEYGKEVVNVIVGNMTFNYGNELIADADLGPMTDAEDEAILSLTSCLTNAEFSVSKQMNGPRSLIKAFSDLCGLPCFTVDGSLISNVFPGVSSCKCVVRLRNVDDLPAVFPNFFGLLESKTRVMKCETHFRKLDLDSWRSIIHIDETNVPSWLMTRLRPIYLANVPDEVYINKFMSLRPDIPILPSVSVDFISHAIKQFNARGIIHSYNTPCEGTCEYMFFYNISEFILTNKVVALKEPMMITIPNSLKQKIDQLSVIFEKFDAFSPHSQSPDFPIIPFATTIDIIVKDPQMAMACVCAAIKENIAIAKFKLKRIRDDLTELEVYGCRPVHINMYSEAEAMNTDAWMSPEPSVLDVLHIALQHPEIKSQSMQIIPYAEDFVYGATDMDESILNASLTKVNLLRRAAKTITKYSVSVMGEAIFTNNYESIEVSPNDELSVALNNYIPIVVYGDISLGKRQYVKNFIFQHCKPEDLVLISSPYNETLDMSVINSLEFITRGLYGPNFDGEIYIVVFDIQNSIPEMKRFIKALLMFNSLFFRTKDQYQSVQGIHFICTTTDISLFDEMSVQYYMINDIPVNKVPFMDFTSNKIKKEAITSVVNNVCETRQFKKAEKFFKLAENVSSIGEFINYTSLFFGADVAAEAASSYDLTKRQVLQLLNADDNSCIFLPDHHLISSLNRIIKLSMSAFVITDSPLQLTNIKDVDFVVLDKKFKTQLFSSLVYSGEHKRKTVFLIDFQLVNKSDVLNLMDFLMFSSGLPDYSTYFEQADIQIFKHYYDPDGKDLPIFSEILKLNSFLVICNQKDYDESVPEIFKKKILTIRKYPYEEICSADVKEEFKYRETKILQPYLTINPHLFEDIVTERSVYFRDKFNIFTDSREDLTKYFEEMGKLSEMVKKINDGIVLTEEEEKRRLTDIENIEEEIDKLYNDFLNIEDLIRKKDEELHELKNNMSNIIPPKIQEVRDKILTYSSQDQKTQLMEWSKTNDPYVNILLAMFSFAEPFGFYENSSKSDNTKLVHAVVKFDYENRDSYEYEKLEPFGYSSNPRPDQPLQVLLSSGVAESQYPLIDCIKEWLKNVVQFAQWGITSDRIVEEIPILKDRKETVEGEHKKKEDELKEAKEQLNERKSGGYCDKWIMDVYLGREAEVTNIIEITESVEEKLKKINKQMEKAQERIDAYSVIYTAFEYGFSSLPIKERFAAYRDFGLAPLLSPFRIFDSAADYEMFFPLTSIIRAFTPPIIPPTIPKPQDPNNKDNKEEEEEKIMATMQKYATMTIFDLLLGLKVFPMSSCLTESFEIPQSDISTPTVVFYDPLDFVIETILTLYPNANCAFTSSGDKALIELINTYDTGVPLIVNIDSLESVHDFFTFDRYIKLQIAANKKIIYRSKTYKIAEDVKIFYITKIEGVTDPNIIIADANIEDLTTTKWFELACVFAVNSKVENAITDDINTLDVAIKGLFQSYKSVLTLSATSFREFISDAESISRFKKSAEALLENIKNYNASSSDLDSILAPSNEHTQSIFRYKKFIDLCKGFSAGSNSNIARMQAIAACNEFSRARGYMPMAAASVQSSISEILMTYVNNVPTSDRMQFLVDYEKNFMSGVLSPQSLLFETTFPKVKERPISTMYSQLMNHVFQLFPATPRTFFSFITPDSLPIPDDHPIVVELDDLIPTDLYSRAMSQYLTTKSKTILTIGSFSNNSLSSPKSVPMIIKGCKDKDAILLLIFDELMPEFIISALLNYSHLAKYSRYYILVNESLAQRIPYIPNSMKIKVSRPTSMYGVTRFLNLTPYYHRLKLDAVRPFLYLNILLSHRKDFPLRLQQILPMLSFAKELYVGNLIGGTTSRELWSKIITILYGTMTPVERIRGSYVKLFEKYFASVTPTFPLAVRVDYDNDASYMKESPPTPNEVGMLVSYGDELTLDDREPTGWKEKIQGRSLTIVRESPQDELIRNATLVNARMQSTDDGLCDTGDVTGIDIFITERKLVNYKNYLPIDIYDGRELVGTVKVPFSGSKDQVPTASVFVLLPPNNQK